MNITLLGIDLAKNIFQLHGVDEKGNTMLKKRISREKLTTFIANLPICTIVMESCASANYWARKFQIFGHQVKLISPHFVKPYVRTNKNDANDAQAICEAASRPHVHFVPIKSIEQQDIQNLHRIRTRLIQSRTALVNQIRGLLAEYGVIIPKGIHHAQKQLPFILEDAANELSSLVRETLADLYEELVQFNKKIADYEKRIETIFNQHEDCQRLAGIPGIGALTATALIAAVGDAKLFKNGRHFAAWLGLVPRQHSSGNQTRLFGISKRGNKYLRFLLTHGGRSIALRCQAKSDKRSIWLVEKIKRSGMNKAVVAIANKNARIAWALLAKQEAYQSNV